MRKKRYIGIGVLLFLAALAMAIPAFAGTSKTNETADFVGGVEAVMPHCYKVSHHGTDFGKLNECLKHQAIEDGTFHRKPLEPISLRCDLYDDQFFATVEVGGVTLKRNVSSFFDCKIVEAELESN